MAAASFNEGFCNASEAQRLTLTTAMASQKPHHYANEPVSRTQSGSCEGCERAVRSRTSHHHAARPGFRIAELQISPTQKVPWHYHNNVHDTFYVLAGSIRIFLQDPKEEVRLTPGQTFAVPPKRPHLVTNAGDTSAVFLVLQGIGE